MFAPHEFKKKILGINFDPSKNMFVQFIKNGENIRLDAPVREENCYKGKVRQIKQLLKKYKVKKSTILWTRFDDGSANLNVYFNKDAAKATMFALLIANHIFKIKKPALHGYETHG